MLWEPCSRMDGQTNGQAGRRSGSADSGFSDVWKQGVFTYYIYDYIIETTLQRYSAEEGMSMRLAAGTISGNGDVGSVCHQSGI